MTDSPYRQLVSNRVKRYKNSGKLVVNGGGGHYLDLNKKLGFTTSDPHKINESTILEDTEWFVEFEKIGYDQWKYIRAFSEQEAPISDIENKAKPIENRINISPSDLLTLDEQIYVGYHEKPGSRKFRLVMTVLSSAIAFYNNIELGLAVSGIGLALTLKQSLIERNEIKDVNQLNKGVDLRKNEIIEAKNRIRESETSRISKILSNFSIWEKMDGQEFEVATGKLFKRQGYSIEYTPASNDGGIDLILKKGDERIGVQCKAYGKNVGG